MISIDPEVFNTAKAYNALKTEAAIAADELQSFIEKLNQAANHSTTPPYAEFTLLKPALPESLDPGVKDYMLQYVRYAEGEPSCTDQNGVSECVSTLQVEDSDLIDMSFDVHKDSSHIMRASCHVRYDTAIKNAESGKVTIQRNLMGGNLLPADQIDSFANYLFTWVFRNMPEKDRPAFLENVEKAGLNQKKHSIGFGPFVKPAAEPASELVH